MVLGMNILGQVKLTNKRKILAGSLASPKGTPSKRHFPIHTIVSTASLQSHLANPPTLMQPPTGQSRTTSSYVAARQQRASCPGHMEDPIRTARNMFWLTCCCSYKMPHLQVHTGVSIHMYTVYIRLYQYVFGEIQHLNH